MFLISNASTIGTVTADELPSVKYHLNIRDGAQSVQENEEENDADLKQDNVTDNLGLSMMVASVCESKSIIDDKSHLNSFIYFHQHSEKWERLVIPEVDDLRMTLKSCRDDKKKMKIFNICRKLYPECEVISVKRMDEFINVTLPPDECVGSSESDMCGSLEVRPYQCIQEEKKEEKPMKKFFKSKSLPVPKHCFFEHIYNQSSCATFESLRLKAMERCLVPPEFGLKSFSMLKPCEKSKNTGDDDDGTVDVNEETFYGIEFVCCPNGATLDSASVNEDSFDEVDSKSKSGMAHDKNKNGGDVEEKDGGDVDYDNEFSNYPSADSSYQDSYYNKQQNDGWVEDSKSDDDTNMYLSRNILAENKKMAMRCYSKAVSNLVDLEVRVIDMNPPNISNNCHGAECNKNAYDGSDNDVVNTMMTKNRLIKCLRKLLKILISDQENTMRRVRQEKDAYSKVTARHLNNIERVANQSISMLTISKELELEVLPVVERYIKKIWNFRRDMTGNKFNSFNNNHLHSKSYDYDLVGFHGNKKGGGLRGHVNDGGGQLLVDEKSQPYVVQSFDDGWNIDNNEELPRGANRNFDSSDDISNRGEDQRRVNDDTTEDHTEQHESSLALKAALAIIVMIIVVLLTVFVRNSLVDRYLQKTPFQQLSEKNDQLNDNEKHLLSWMQSNGYENPTYRFFEPISA